jgi:hypothetical protein
MQRAFSSFSFSARKSNFRRVPTVDASGLTFDVLGMPTEWVRWQSLVAWVIWQNSSEVHKSFVFAQRLVVPDTTSLVKCLLDTLEDPFKAIPFDGDLDPAVIRTSVLDFVHVWLELSFRDFGLSSLHTLFRGLEDLVSPSTMKQYRNLGVRRVNTQSIALSNGEPLVKFPPLALPNLDAFSDAVGIVGRMVFLELTGDSLLKNQSQQSVHQHFNRLSASVASWILSETSRASQIRVMAFFVEAAANCFNAHDLFGAMALTAGLICHDVSRLRLTQDLPEVHQGTIVRLEEKLAGENNFSLLRSAERALFEGAVPTIPYIPMHLKDFVTVTETGMIPFFCCFP